MIYIGLAGWGDHDTLYPDKIQSRDKLSEYAAHFPIVELDSSFYAVQPQRNMEKWTAETPDRFQFVVKAYQGMTGHQRGEIPFDSKKEMFEAFRLSLQPLQQAGKIGMVLFQFPPWFDCTKEHVTYLRYCREMIGDVPAALEFRNKTWYQPEFYEQTLQFMYKENWIHTVCDEPQVGEGSVPTVLHASDSEKTLIRFHGRNKEGWRRPSKGNWREVRYLYRYNEEELKDWCKKIKQLEKQTKDIYIIFNNNSGGDAADNAKQMLDLLEIKYEDLAPRQLDLFD
ncbi:DUF72 domain-containing protein [Bacillus tianshenii]|nr:DUF72 domain-containing protein [Bacillus tianshenii]